MDKLCFSAMATERSPVVSHNYRFMSTMDVVNYLTGKGWEIDCSRQTAVRKDIEHRSGYQKHTVIFSDPNYNAKVVGDVRPRILVTNAHDGTSSFIFRLGLYRLVCANGLVVSTGIEDKIRILHKGINYLQIDETINKLMVKFEHILDTIKGMQAKNLTNEQLSEFADKAASIRWGTKTPINASEFIALRRQEDKGNDLWSVLNRVQENIVRGGQEYTVQRANGTTRANTVRAIRGMNKDINFNARLWELAETYLQAA